MCRRVANKQMEEEESNFADSSLVISGTSDIRRIAVKSRQDHAYKLSYDMHTSSDNKARMPSRSTDSKSKRWLVEIKRHGTYAVPSNLRVGWVK